MITDYTIGATENIRRYSLIKCFVDVLKTIKENCGCVWSRFFEEPESRCDERRATKKKLGTVV